LHPSTLAKRGTVLLFLVIIAAYFFGLGGLPLLGPDEPRYAEVAREMLMRHDLVSPTLGGHLWFEKPALLYWMMIASFKVFGVTEWAARLPSAVSGLLTVVAVFVTGRRVERVGAPDNELQSYAFWSGLAAATMIGIAAFSRAASFDILLTMTTTWTLAFFVLADPDQALADRSEANPKHRNWFLAGFYTFIGLSLLAKGLVGIVIPVGVLGSYYLFQRRLPGRKLLTSLIWGLPLALMVAATWYLPVVRRHGWLFIDQFFIQHHFARYISNKYHHSQPVYYYLLILPLLALPWTAFLPDGLMQSRLWLKRPADHQVAPAEAQVRQLMILALAWLLFPLLFFSFSNSKLPGYILPILPAAALIVGERLVRLYRRSRTERNSEASDWPIGASAILSLLFAVAVIVYASRTAALSVACAAVIAGLLLVGSSFAFVFRRRLTAAALLSFPISTAAVLLVAMYSVMPAFADLDSSKRLLQLADEHGYSQTAIYGMQRSDRSPEFYAAARVVYGADGEPIMYEDPERVVEESRKRGDVLLAFVPVRKVSQLTGMTSAQTEVIGSTALYALVAVRAR
jgi:4-amino-4-deoxy-L-arabinose transferase-like glycosyltransferase